MMSSFLNNSGKEILLLSMFIVLTYQVPSSEKLNTWPSKIVGGTLAEKNELPYQVSIRYLGHHFCGGTILNEDYILTAAHCIRYLNLPQVNVSEVFIFGGDHSLKKEDGTEQQRQIQNVKAHEEYNKRTQANDIALIKLTSPFLFNEFVHSIPLSPQGHQASGDALTSGWGTLSTDKNVTEYLYKVTVPILTDEACRIAYRAIDREIADSMICAGYPEGGKDSCQGDSGGPFIAYDLGHAYLAGIISWGRGCGLPDFPGVYTEVSYFHQWILTNAT